MSQPPAKGSVIVADGFGKVTIISPTSSNQVFALDSNDPRGAKFIDVKDIMPNQKVKMAASSSNFTLLNSYQQILEISVPGELNNNIVSIKVVSYAQSGVGSYSIIVTNSLGQTIAENTFSNNSSAENNMGALANLPQSTDIIHFSIKKNNGPANKNAYLMSVDLEMTA